MCSPLLVRYGTVEMTAVIIIIRSDQQFGKVIIKEIKNKEDFLNPLSVLIHNVLFLKCVNIFLMLIN